MLTVSPILPEFGTVAERAAGLETSAVNGESLTRFPAKVSSISCGPAVKIHKPVSQQKPAYQHKLPTYWVC